MQADRQTHAALERGPGIDVIHGDCRGDGAPARRDVDPRAVLHDRTAQRGRDAQDPRGARRAAGVGDVDWCGGAGRDHDAARRAAGRGGPRAGRGDRVGRGRDAGIAHAETLRLGGGGKDRDGRAVGRDGHPVIRDPHGVGPRIRGLNPGGTELEGADGRTTHAIGRRHYRRTAGIDCDTRRAGADARDRRLGRTGNGIGVRSRTLVLDRKGRAIPAGVVGAQRLGPPVRCHGDRVPADRDFVPPRVARAAAAGEQLQSPCPHPSHAVGHADRAGRARRHRRARRVGDTTRHVRRAAARQRVRDGRGPEVLDIELDTVAAGVGRLVRRDGSFGRHGDGGRHDGDGVVTPAVVGRLGTLRGQDEGAAGRAHLIGDLDANAVSPDQARRGRSDRPAGHAASGGAGEGVRVAAVQVRLDVELHR